MSATKPGPNLPDRLRSLASQCRKQMPQGWPRTLDDMAREVEELEKELRDMKGDGK